MENNSGNTDLSSFKPDRKYSPVRPDSGSSVRELDTGSTSVVQEPVQTWVPNDSYKLLSEIGAETTAFDVAAYVLDKYGSMTTMKLHKLLYYCQAWSLVWDEKPLYNEEIQAWANGPVIKDLFYYHKGSFSISNISIGNKDALSPAQKETIDSVCNYYGDKPAQWLIELTHLEEPWITARKGLSATARGSNPITLESMAEYYSSL